MPFIDIIISHSVFCHSADVEGANILDNGVTLKEVVSLSPTFLSLDKSQ